MLLDALTSLSWGPPSRHKQAYRSHRVLEINIILQFAHTLQQEMMVKQYCFRYFVEWESEIEQYQTTQTNYKKIVFHRILE